MVTFTQKFLVDLVDLLAEQLVELSMKNKGKKILFLGDKDSPLSLWLTEQEGSDVVLQSSEKISPSFLLENHIGFIVSYGYRHIIQSDVLDLLPNKVINLHISFLPWNRGADPNLWSFIENTPKGVTIHYVDEGLDTGDVIVQEEVTLSGNETLASSYDLLQAAIQDLFKAHWQNIKSGACNRIKQQGSGSSHKVKDKEAIAYLLTHGWDTPVNQLVGSGQQENTQ